MRKWGNQSQLVYDTLHPTLQHYLDRALQEVADMSLVCGHRGQVDQNAAFDSGHSKLRWPHGKHNHLPSIAVDLQPYPNDGSKEKQWAGLAYIAGSMIQMAKHDGVVLRWGGDWDRDGCLTDQNFDDLYHVELVLPPSKWHYPLDNET